MLLPPGLIYSAYLTVTLTLSTTWYRSIEGDMAPKDTGMLLCVPIVSIHISLADRDETLNPFQCHQDYRGTHTRMLMEFGQPECSLCKVTAAHAAFWQQRQW